MPSAAILAFDGCYASCAAGYADILQVANAHLKRQHGATADPFKWRFVSLGRDSITASNGLALSTHRVGPRERYDLVFIPSVHYTGRRALDALLKNEHESRAWLTRQWEAGAWLAANCTGTFLLASTGLLDHRTATTTWWLEQQFRARFPLVDLQLHPVVTEADRLLCAGASASYLLQSIKIVEHFCGRAIAAQAARSMLIDVSQTTQAPFLPLLAEKEHTDSLVSRAQHWLQSHMQREFRLGELARALAVSEKTIARRFRAVLDATPLGYVQNLRLETARSLLELGDLNIDQIAAQVGYSDASSFSRLFRERMGMSPGAYRGRYAASPASAASESGPPDRPG